MQPLQPIEPEGSCAGLLLVAHPTLRDHHFRRTVIYLSAHGPEAGAFGLILNRPLGKAASELLPEHGDLLAQTPVYLGGPVAHDQLSFAHVRWDALDERLDLKHNLSLEELAERADDEPSSVRAFVGYAGWAAGQLEEELRRESWVLVAAPFETVDPEAGEKLWFDVMTALGPAYKLQAAAPDDPSLN